ncbi:hypothetical protein WJX84_010708 [Apatococcus fuscideae]|uniref:Uncharacterized protein n=1 Tax=Apatococcus fuscideae TaxID=2026836 RepID=A0AAW1T1R4_9CHLO
MQPASPEAALAGNVGRESETLPPSDSGVATGQQQLGQPLVSSSDETIRAVSEPAIAPLEPPVERQESRAEKVSRLKAHKSEASLQAERMDHGL